MAEKKTVRISVRVPQSWKRTISERGIKTSYICRAALFQAINQTDPVLRSGAKLRSKQRAAALWSGLSSVTVRTISEDHTKILTELPFKIIEFRKIMMPACNPAELQVLGEFLEQEEYAEEVLQDVYV